MTKWEYHIEPMATNSSPNEIMLKRINELGEQGWEMIYLFPSPCHLLFKRQVENQEA